MLSTDIVTEFRDKASQIHMHPLSFEEFYSYRMAKTFMIETDGGCHLQSSDENQRNILKGNLKHKYY